MRRFLVKILITGLILPIVWFLFVGVFGKVAPEPYKKNLRYLPVSYGHMLTRLEEANTSGNVQVVVTGSSHAYRGFDPRVFEEHGISMFNLGSSSQTPIQTEYLLNKYLEQLNPSMVIMEVYPKTLQSDGIESSIDIVSKVDVDWDLVAMTMRINKPSIYNVVAFNLFNQLTGTQGEHSESIVKKRDTYIPGGFVQKEMKSNENIQEFEVAPVVLRDAQVKAFERIINTLTGKGIRVILVQAPVTSEWYASIENKAELDKYFRSFDNVEYYNFNELLDLDSRQHFYDHHHLNQIGVGLFNEALITELGL